MGQGRRLRAGEAGLSTSLQIVGTRAGTENSFLSLFDGNGTPSGCGGCIASAYWDATALVRVLELAELSGGVVRVILWTAGATRTAWEAARPLADDPRIDLRFVDPPESGGIFHVKLAGVLDESAGWSCAVIGSANLTDAALRKNVELGVTIRGDVTALAELRRWFDEQFTAATPATQFDWDRAIEIAPAKSQAAEHRTTFAEAGLATPAHAGPIEPAR